MPELAKTYDPKQVEEKIYRLWEESGYFASENLPATPSAKPFAMIMPPPNANGALHAGHALMLTLQDIMIRFERMRGKKALWLPGADHAGFETQVVFDKKLEKEGRNRFEIPREELYKEIWEFTQKNKAAMEDQIRKTGASCDWSRERFTFDPNIVEIVYETFQKLYEDGLAYRDLRVVNWCPKHQTALSDLEVKYVEREDPLYYIKYGPLTLATVRPETKFGDTALAVNPKDKRYQKYIGKEIEAKGLLGPLTFKVVGDEAVDPKFGTGVVKVTPAHDPADFEIWSRHKGEIPGPKQIIDERGRLTKEAGPYAGLKVAEARQKVAEDMQKLGILEKTDPSYKHQIATCYKCGNTLEPLPKMQWFIAMTKALRNQKSKIKNQNVGTSLRDIAVDAVKTGKVKFVTKRFEKIFFHWMKNLRDWNISRQIVWGIRIPAWYCGGKEKSAEPKMGFHKDVIPQVFDGKTKTYRLRDHGFRVGQKVLFENTQTKTLFGYGVMKEVEETIVEKIDYRDKTHYKTYENLNELIRAFRLRNPDRVVTPKTEAYLYAYEFHHFTAKDAEEGCGQIVISSEKPLHCLACDGVKFEQDTDVFDTWFSSGQWPYASLLATSDKGQGTRDFKEFYPTDVMATGYDILFFWVARMIMLGLYRTGEVPFKTIYLHGLVRDKDKQKMSKSKGNVIDPLGIAEQYGMDALRMGLIAGTSAGNDVVLSEDKIRGYRNFATKIWNLSRFIAFQRELTINNLRQTTSKPTVADKKYIKEFEQVKKKVTKHLEAFEFHRASEDIYHYTWHTFADKIVEGAKPRLRGNDSGDKDAALAMLEHIFLGCLKLLHPFMPFVTESIYQELSSADHQAKMLMVEPW